MKNKILILSGYSNNGKSTVLDELVKKYNFRNIVSFTTRPIRKNEIEGKDYFFITKDKFHSMAEKNEFIGTRSYITKVEVDGKSMNDVWYYSLHKNQFKNTDKPSCVIVDKQGAEELIKYLGENSYVWIYLECEEDILKRRGLIRGDYEEEIIRRIRSDKKNFKGIENVVHSTVNSDMPLKEVVKAVEIS